MSEPKVIAKNVTLYPEHWEVVEAVDARFGFRNTSTALRFIVSEYQRLADVQTLKNAAPDANGQTSE